PGFLVVEDFIDAGGPTAQAAVSDVEGNQGFASVPYPGELAIAGPGLFAIATGHQFPGHYPFYVASAHPTTPKNEYDVPGLSMEISVMKVGDTPVGVRDGQFVVAGTTLPLSGFAPVQKALGDAGVSVEVVQATKTDDGVVSPGIQITRQQDTAAAGTKLVVRY